MTATRNTRLMVRLEIFTTNCYQHLPQRCSTLTSLFIPSHPITSNGIVGIVTEQLNPPWQPSTSTVLTSSLIASSKQS